MINKVIYKLNSLLFPKPVFNKHFNSKFIKIFSHPRSGTHFLEAFLAANFYTKEDLFVPKAIWGHWSDRKINIKGSQFGKLFGSHLFPDSSIKKIDRPIVYIYRNGKDVAYSVWKTPNFINPKYKGISFSDFLRIKLDWKGSPAYRSKEKSTILEHWDEHVKAWMKYAKSNKNIIIIKYEDLVNNPYDVYLVLHSSCFNEQNILTKEEINPIKTPLGLLPNKAKIDSWKDVFSQSDLNYFTSIVDKSILDK